MSRRHHTNDDSHTRLHSSATSPAAMHRRRTTLLSFAVVFLSLLCLCSFVFAQPSSNDDAINSFIDDMTFEEAEHEIDTMNIEELLDHTLIDSDSAASVDAVDPWMNLPPYVQPDWSTKNRSMGMCAMYGSCFGDPPRRVINCPANVPAVMVSATLLNLAANARGPTQLPSIVTLTHSPCSFFLSSLLLSLLPSVLVFFFSLCVVISINTMLWPLVSHKLPPF